MIKFKKLTPKAYDPEPTPSGFDIKILERKDIEPDQVYTAGSGLSVSIPEGYVGILYPRSKMALRKNVKIAAQIVHKDYPHELQINLHNDGKDLLELKAGEAVAQLIVVPCLTEFTVE